MDYYIYDEEIREQLLRQRRLAARKKRRRRQITALCVAVILVILSGFLLGKVAGLLIYKVTDKRIVETAEDVPIVNTAIAEVGNEGGEPFWSWFGFDSYVEWCACFVSWCEDQNGYLDEGIAPRFALVSDGGDWFENAGQWLDADSTPSVGDIIFFDWEQDGGRDHVGIVSGVVNDKVFTVEGNSSDRCRVKCYAIGSPVIYGYGHIDTNGNTDTEE